MDEAKIIELEKRVSLLEGWKEGHGEVLESIRRDMDDLKTRVTSLEQKMDRKFAEMDEKIFALDQKMDKKFSEVDKKIFALDQKMDKKFSEVDQKIFALDQKIFALDQKMTRFFMWVIGIQFGIFIAIILMLLRQ